MVEQPAGAAIHYAQAGGGCLQSLQADLLPDGDQGRTFRFLSPHLQVGAGGAPAKLSRAYRSRASVPVEMLRKHAGDAGSLPVLQLDDVRATHAFPTPQQG